jgi:hypothetical protein
VERGSDALHVLTRTLKSEDTGISVRSHVPRTISRFATTEAVDILLQCLGEVKSGMVRYKILRGLQPLFASPLGQTADKRRIVEELGATVDRTLVLLHREGELLRGQSESPERETTGGRLLAELLKDKRKLATGRIFLLLSLLYPSEDFRKIQSGLRSDRPAARASSFELLENLLSRDIGRSILGVVTEGSPIERLRAADSELASERLAYAPIVSELEQDPSEAVRAFAMYHAGEIDLAAPPEVLREGGRFTSLRDRALEVIEALPDSFDWRRVPADETAGF